MKDLDSLKVFERCVMCVKVFVAVMFDGGSCLTAVISVIIFDLVRQGL